MKIKNIYINNFKAYRNTMFHADESLNVITGTNNSGKTTVLEAIALWHECFSLLLMRAKKATRGTTIKSGYYRLGKKAQNYFDYRAIHSVRSYRFNDIFYELTISNQIEIGISFTDNNGVTKEICFKIRGASGSSNYEIILKDHDKFDFEWFNNSFKHLPEPIGCYFALPIAVISAYEEFATKPIIKNRVTSRESSSYIRNRLYLLSKQKEAFDAFSNDVSFILNNNKSKIYFNIESDIDRDTNINVSIRMGIELSYKDVSLLGSGTLQIIGLLLTCYEEEKDLNLVLLDEPDSHIHRDIQKRLIQTLQKKTTATQIFLTTHNEGLIRSTHPKNIFHIEENICTSDKTDIYPIISEVNNQRQKGASIDHHSSIISKIHSTSSLDIIGFIEADLILLVEGIDDIKYIKKILEMYEVHMNCAFWSFKGVDSLLQEIKHFKSFLDGIGSSEPLWNKSKIIIDSDYLTKDQTNNLTQKIKEDISIDCFIWDSYTIESSIFTNRHSFTNFIAALFKDRGFTIDHINDVIETHWSQYIELYKEKLSSKKHSEKVTGQLTARSSHIRKFLLKNPLNITKIFGCQEAMYYPTYMAYSLEKIKQCDISHACDKSDLKDILHGITSSLSLCPPNIDIEDYFYFSLDNMFLNGAAGFPEIHRFVRFLNSYNRVYKTS
ncbi:AAA family ATPase [Aeromonas dhakensis]|uniref:AAA family ATPase n=2 Tax=Aeromonas TaxID=642 RepID=UPI00300E51C2